MTGTGYSGNNCRGSAMTGTGYSGKNRMGSAMTGTGYSVKESQGFCNDRNRVSGKNHRVLQ